MDRLLVQRDKFWLRTCIALVLLCGGIIFVAQAGSYYGKFTGYAMGNRYGAAGVEVRQGHFANHACELCPNDPAACWPWGTKITKTKSVTMHNRDGGQVSYRTFYLYDNGDPNCTQPNYWVDLYFGRWKRYGQTCSCSGSPSPGYCIDTYVVNACDDASNFGAQKDTYTGP